MRAIDINFSVSNATERGEMRSTDTGTIALRSSGGSPSLRALTEEPGDHDESAYTSDKLNENKIDKLDIFLSLKAEGGASYFKHFADAAIERLEMPSAGSHTYKVRVLIPYSERSMYEGKEFDIVVVANAKDDLSTGISSLEDLKRKVQTDDLNPTSGASAPQPQSHFLMDGIGSTGMVHFTDNLHTVATPILLHRAAAKIRLRMPQELKIFNNQNGQKVQYHLVGNLQVKLVSYVTKTSLLKGSPYEVQAGEWISTPYRDMTLRSLPAREGSTVTSYLSSFPFYAYESRWGKAGDVREAHLIVKANLAPKRPDGALGAGKDYYYRIPLNYTMAITGVDSNTLHRVDRNHLYDILSEIEVLGSESEDEPVDISSHVAVQPWNTPDVIDGSLSDAHYLLVKEKNPKILNIDHYQIEYTSDLPVDIEILEVYYEYYDKGVYVREENPDQGTIRATEPHTRGHIDIRHKIPVNYLPLYINFKVKQREGILEETVKAIQYPHRYLTYIQSPGRSGGRTLVKINGNWDSGYTSDFRYHTTFGTIWNTNIIQNNNIFTKITTLVPEPGEKIGKPRDPSAPGNTATDADAGELISPEFIMATQYGMSVRVPQYTTSTTYEGWTWDYYYFTAGYGPASKTFPQVWPYRNETTLDNSAGYKRIYRDYNTAGERAKKYFEGEYGKTGYYKEHYVNSAGFRVSRSVHKTFEYDGSWRIPTAAELRAVAKIQHDPNSKTKHLLEGTYYWCAQTDHVVDVQNATSKFPIHSTSSTYVTNVRLIFDTWEWQVEGE